MSRRWTMWLWSCAKQQFVTSSFCRATSNIVAFRHSLRNCLWWSEEKYPKTPFWAVKKKRLTIIWSRLTTLLCITYTRNSSTLTSKARRRNNFRESWRLLKSCPLPVLGSKSKRTWNIRGKWRSRKLQGCRNSKLREANSNSFKRWLKSLRVPIHCTRKIASMQMIC